MLLISTPNTQKYSKLQKTKSKIICYDCKFFKRNKTKQRNQNINVMNKEKIQEAFEKTRIAEV